MSMAVHETLSMGTQLWLPRTLHVPWHIPLLLIFPTIIYKCKRHSCLWSWKTGGGPDLPQRPQLSCPCSKPRLLIEKSSHYGHRFQRSYNQALHSLCKYGLAKVSKWPTCLPLSLSLSPPLKHPSPEMRPEPPPCSRAGSHTCSLISWSFRLCSLISWRSCSALSSSWDTSIRACSKLRFKLCRKQKF